MSLAAVPVFPATEYPSTAALVPVPRSTTFSRIDVSVAAVSGVIACRRAFGAIGWRTPSRTSARTTCGSKIVPPLATALTAVAIWSGVTLI